MAKTLTQIFNETAEAIQEKTGSLEPIPAENFGEEIRNIPTGDTPNMSEYFSTDEQRSILYNVTFDAEKILNLVKKYGVDTSLPIFDNEQGDLLFQLTIDPSSNYLFDGDPSGTIIGFAYYLSKYVIDGIRLSTTFNPEDTIEEIILNSSYAFYTNKFKYDNISYILSLIVTTSENTYSFQTLVKWQDLIDCIVNTNEVNE